MKTYNLLTIGLFCSLLLISCSSTSNLSSSSSGAVTPTLQSWQYEIEPVQTGVTGTYLIKVWSYVTDPNMITEVATKNAIHGVLFKGFPNNGRITGQPAIIRDPSKESENADFFREFFSNNGEYLRYVTLTNNGSIAPGDRLKIGEGRKASYKIGMTVSVNQALLRKRMEDLGIAKSLTDGF